MDSFLGLIAQFLVSIGFDWYRDQFMVGLSELPQLLLSFLLTYLVIQLFFYIFPPLKKLMMVLGAPFRYMHVWLHVDTARRIERKKLGFNQHKNGAVGFWGETKGNDMIPLLHTQFSTLDALKIAGAPLLGAIALFIFLIVSSPIFAGLGLYGLILHIYLLFCCFGIAFPSLKDFSFLVKGQTVQASSIHPGYFLWAYFIFALSGYITMQQTSSAMAGLRDGCLYALGYLVLLVSISKIGNRNSVPG